jgi:ABC-type siderophore export system fused ATPase/permease subunit
MMLLLKKIYGWEGHNLLQDIMDNEEILQNFFDTVEEGRAFLRLLKRRREYTKQQQNANAKRSWHQHLLFAGSFL